MKVAFWLIPTEHDRVMYQRLIDTLAQTYDAPSFTPHVTIDFGEYQSNLEIDKLIQMAIESIAPFSMRCDRILYSAQFTKTLFVQLDAHPSLHQLFDRFKTASITSDFVLDPHLSLIYGSLSLEQKQHLAETLTLPKSPIWFDEIRAIVAPIEAETYEAVTQWQVLYATKLAPA
jgi:Cyclic phosphodiesterase-like protein